MSTCQESNSVAMQPASSVQMLVYVAFSQRHWSF